MTDDQAALANYGGTVRLFPLPKLVLFPHAVQGLHIFEPRYRQMMADALAGDRLIAPVLLKPGWEEHDDESPPVEPCACVGRIVWHERLPDGRYNLRLRGLSRVRIAEEVPTGKLYRTARAGLVADVVSSDPPALTAWRRKVAAAVLPRFDADRPFQKRLRELFDGDMTLGHVTDVLSHALPLPPELKQALLCETKVERRAEVLVYAMDLTATREARRFPPEFSAN